ncbi:DUF3313 domain-containing protein [Petrachloros mirabilis]
MRRFIGLLSIVVLVTASGCAATQQAKSVQKSGFMDQKTYSMLEEGKKVSVFGESAEDMSLLVYLNKDADWRKYKKIHLDPVTVFVGKDSPLSHVKPEDRKMLANVMFHDMNEALSKDYEMTRDYDADTLWVQVAITEAGESDVVLDTISSVIPQLKVLTGAKGLATGVSGFTGEASSELKISDASTGTLLAAAVDRRGGTKSLKGVTDSWHDVLEAYRFWSEKLRYRLCQIRGGANCVKPEA